MDSRQHEQSKEKCIGVRNEKMISFEHSTVDCMILWKSARYHKGWKINVNYRYVQKKVHSVVESSGKENNKSW